jgi:hypothetical protein
VHRRACRLDWPILLLAGLVVAALYWPTLRFDLFEDDYFLLRPWSPEHLANVLTGPWLQADSPDYYRPVAIYIYKALFFTFGLNTRALHVVPLVTMTVLAWLLGRVVRRETGSVRLGATAAVLYAIHPSTATAIGPWISNQYQGVISACLLVTLILWQWCRDKPWPYWLPLLVPITIGAFTKETGLMIPLMIVGVHLARAHWTKDVPALSPGPLVLLLGLFIALNVWRIVALGTLAETFSPDLGAMIVNFVRGPYAVLLDPINGWLPWHKVVFGGATLALAVAGGRALLTRAPGAAAVVLTGIVILLLAAIPSSVIFSRRRLTPHDVGVVLILIGGLAALLPYIRGRLRLAALALGLVAMAASVGLTREAIQRFNPCVARTLEDPDYLVQEPRQPPPEMVRWLKALPRPCDPTRHAPFFRATSRITWGVTEQRTSPADIVHLWIRARVVGLLDPRGKAVIVQFRHPGATAGAPVRVRISINNGPDVNLTLTSADWQSLQVALAPTFRSWLRQMHRLEMHLEPEDRLGLEMRPLDVVY